MSPARAWTRTRPRRLAARLRRAWRFSWLAATDQDRLLFRPRASDRITLDALGLTYEQHTLSVADTQVRLWWVPGPSTPAPVVLLLGGALGNISDESRSMALLQRLGATVCAIDYPGFGPSSVRPSVRGCQAAAAAAWAFVRARGYDSSAVVIFGRSFGSAVAVWLASNVERPRALVLHSGFGAISELVALYLPRVPPRLIRWLCRIRLDAERFAREVDCEVLMLHGRADQLVPIECARRLADRFRHGCRLVELSADHFGDGWCHDAHAKAAVRELLTPTGPN